MSKNRSLPKQSHRGLGNWVGTQRTNYKKNKLSKEQKRLLETIRGWFWSRDNRWFEKAQTLKTHINKNRELPKKSNTEFCLWIDTQRQNYKKNKLSQDRIDFLEAIPEWYWNVLKKVRS